MKCGLGAFLGNRRGAVTIEFVCTLPLFLAALAFAFEFGQIFLAHQATVNNVRSAARYLSRSDLSAGEIAMATNMVRTGQLVGGVTPEYLTPTSATVSVNETYTEFTAPTFSRNGKTLRIAVRVEYPLTIFSFAGDGRATIPFAVVEDLRFVGV